MKKYALLIIILCFSLVGCKNGVENIENPEITSLNNSLIAVNNQNASIAESEDFIYYIDFMTVKKLSKADNSIADVFLSNQFLFGLEYFEDRLYLITTNGLISVDIMGQNILKAPIPDGAQKFRGDSFYIFGKYLYLKSFLDDLVYRINPDTLELEPAEAEIKNKHMISDGTVFTQLKEDGVERIYKQSSNKKSDLFSAENENVNSSYINFTDKYIFYAASKDELTTLSLYRVDLNKKNKVLIKEFSADNSNASISYDNEYIYLVLNSDQYLKINKETLDEKDISSIIEIAYPYHREVASGKFFYLLIEKQYFIDSETGEKVYL